MTKKVLMVFMAIFLVVSISARVSNGSGSGSGIGGQHRFIDEDGDGINDNFRDHDGDGIPNHQDPDWTRPKDGSGYKNRHGSKNGFSSDNHNRHRRGSGFGDSGFGPGTCNGDGPFGSANNNRHRHGGNGKD